MGIIAKIADFFQILWCDNGCGNFAGFETITWSDIFGKKSVGCDVITIPAAECSQTFYNGFREITRRTQLGFTTTVVQIKLPNYKRLQPPESQGVWDDKLSELTVFIMKVYCNSFHPRVVCVTRIIDVTFVNLRKMRGKNQQWCEHCAMTKKYSIGQALKS